MLFFSYTWQFCSFHPRLTYEFYPNFIIFICHLVISVSNHIYAMKYYPNISFFQIHLVILIFQAFKFLKFFNNLTIPSKKSLTPAIPTNVFHANITLFLFFCLSVYFCFEKFRFISLKPLSLFLF